MGDQERVQIVEVWKVQPTETLTIATPKPLPLTLFDMRFLRLPFVKRVYFFNKSSPNVVPRLKYSLSLTLGHFLPLAGNLVWPKSSTIPFVRYVKGDGVSFFVAEPGQDLSFKVLSGSDIAVQTEGYGLVPNLVISGEKAAVAAVQVTVFPDEGFSIGVTLHHAVLDGKSEHMFIKSWAHICKSLESEGFSPLRLPVELRPFFDRTDVQDPRRIGESFARKWMSLNGPENRSLVPLETKPSKDLVRGTFTLTLQDIEKIRLMVPSPIRRSTFSLAFAYLWVCRVKAEGIYSNDSKAVFGFAGDLRSRLDPPLPVNYWGNCVASTFVVTKAKDLTEDWKMGLTSALNAISEGTKKFNSDDVLVGAMDWLSQWDTFEGNLCFLGGSWRYGSYATDFGWGKPVKTDVVSLESVRAILMQDTRDGDGIEFRMSMEKPRMEAFVSLFCLGLESF